MPLSQRKTKVCVPPAGAAESLAQSLLSATGVG